MNVLTWQEFVENVQQWASDRGIYEYSTPNAQLLKALSELGELADAVIKNDRDGIKDAIGDVAVCMINYAFMEEIPFEEAELPHEHLTDLAGIGNVIESIAIMAHNIGQLITNELRDEQEDYLSAQLILCLGIVSIINNFDFLECCTKAWNEIKDRKGRMVAGGAFVKDE